MGVDPQLLELLVCPDCHGELREEGDTLICQECGLHYPVRDDVPIMLIEEAWRPDSDAGDNA